MSGRDVTDRLARAVASADADGPKAEFMKALSAAIFGQLPPERALLLERWLGHVAAAGEELGEDASAEAIIARADALDARPT